MGGEIDALASLAGGLERLLQEGEVIVVATEDVGGVAGEAEVFGLEDEAGIEGEAGLTALSGGRGDTLLPGGEEGMGGERGRHSGGERERLLSEKRVLDERQEQKRAHRSTEQWQDQT